MIDSVQKAKQQLLLFDIVAASIVLNSKPKYLWFSLLFCVWLLSQSHCILQDLVHDSFGKLSSTTKRRLAREGHTERMTTKIRLH